MGFTPCKAKQPLKGMEIKHTGNLFRKNLQSIVC